MLKISSSYSGNDLIYSSISLGIEDQAVFRFTGAIAGILVSYHSKLPFNSRALLNLGYQPNFSNSVKISIKRTSDIGLLNRSSRPVTP